MYWRRRLLVVLGVIVALLLLFLLLKPDPNSGVVASSPSPSPTGSGAPTTSGTATPSTSGSPSGSPSPTATGDVCNDSDIEVTISPRGGTSFATGTPITFTMLVKNTSSRACTRDVGAKVNTIEVTSGSVHVWSSDDCAATGGSDLKALPPTVSYAVASTWNQTLSAPNCPAGQPTAKPGSYEVVGINNGLKSAPVTFAIK